MSADTSNICFGGGLMTRLNFDKKFRGFEWEGARSEATRWAAPDASEEKPLPAPTVAEIWAESERMGRLIIKLRAEAMVAERQSLIKKGSQSRALAHEASIKRDGARNIITKIMLSLGLLRGKGFSIVEIQTLLSDRQPELAVILREQDAWRDFW